MFVHLENVTFPDSLGGAELLSESRELISTGKSRRSERFARMVYSREFSLMISKELLLFLMIVFKVDLVAEFHLVKSCPILALK